jgi:hypothetical protein
MEAVVLQVDERGRAVGELSHHIEFDTFTTSDGWMTSWPASFLQPDKSVALDFRLASGWCHSDGRVGRKLTDDEAIAIIKSIESTSDDKLLRPVRALWALLEKLDPGGPRVYILPSGDRFEGR